MNNQRPANQNHIPMQTRKYLLAGISSAVFFSTALLAQRAPEQSQSAPGQSQQAVPGGNAPAAPASIESVKPLIKATDEEWKVIGPKLQAVVTARQTVITYAAAPTGLGGFGPGGPGGFGADSFAGPVGDTLGFAGGRGGRGGGPGGPGGRGGGPGNPGGPGGPGGRGGMEGLDLAALAAAFAGRGGGGAGGVPEIFGGNNNAVSSALAELKKALADSTSTPAQVKAKLAEVRSARQKAAADLAAAQKDLLRLLTADQETTLVSLGYID